MSTDDAVTIERCHKMNGTSYCFSKLIGTTVNFVTYGITEKRQQRAAIYLSGLFDVKIASAQTSRFMKEIVQ